MYFFVVLLITLVIEPCIAPPVGMNETYDPCPSECHVGGDFIPFGNSLSTSYWELVAYSVTSTTSAAEACDSVLGSEINLNTSVTVRQTGTTVGENQQSTALVSLISSLGLTGCSPSVSPTIQSLHISTETLVSSITSPALPLLSSPSSSSSLSSPTTSSSPSASSAGPVSRGLNKQDEIAVGVVVPIAVFASLLVILICWRRYRTRRQGDIGNNTTLRENKQPYLQQKPELEAEEKRTYEMEAQEVRYEMQGEHTIHELGPEGDIRRISRLQELQGPEHSKELEVPDELS